MAESKKPAGKKKAPAKKKSAGKPRKATQPPPRPKPPDPATAPLPPPDRPPPHKVFNEPVHPHGGKTLLELLREQRDEAERNLKDVKSSLNHMHRWKGEDWKHYFRRRHLMRRKRAYRRRIVEGYQNRVDAAAKRQEDRRDAKTEHDKGNPFDAHGGGVVTFDGKLCVEWIAHDLLEMRNHGWNGYLVSGYRTPADSQQLCYDQCGAPSCSGTCAGTASNHCKQGDGQGAADVTDYINAERVAYEIGSRLHNNLPRDLVHLSATGY